MPRRQRPTAVACRLGVVQATGWRRYQPADRLGQVGVTGVPNLWPLPCEYKHGRPSTSNNAAIVLPTSPFAVVVCRLLPSGGGVFAACSPPAVLAWVARSCLTRFKLGGELCGNRAKEVIDGTIGR
jgi:hypothetical protein